MYRMSSQIGIWSQSKNAYLIERITDEIYYIDEKPWSSYVKEADALKVEEFIKYRVEYEFIMSKFRQHARLLADNLIKTQYDYSGWVHQHISNYLLCGPTTADTSRHLFRKATKICR